MKGGIKDKAASLLQKTGRYALYGLVGIAGSLILSAVYYGLFALVFSTDTEKLLVAENRIYREWLPEVSDRVTLLNDEMRCFEGRDADIYGKVFKADAPMVSELVDGDIFAAETENGGNIIRRTFAKSSAAMDMASSIEDDWRAVFELVGGSGKNPPPVGIPVPNVKYTGVGASVGEKMSPFYMTLMRHDGVDLIAPAGTGVTAVAAGRVSLVRKSEGGRGNEVEITHSGGFRTRYAHLGDVFVKPGMQLKAGETVGTVGNSGRSFTTHLHYELMRDGRVMDPVHFFAPFLTPEEYLDFLIVSASSGQSMD